MKQYKKITSHGSVSIPVAMRREIGLQPKDPMEVSVNTEGDIVLRQYVPRCIFCGGTQDVRKAFGRNVCTECARKVYELLKEKEEHNGGIETEDKRTIGG